MTGTVQYAGYQSAAGNYIVIDNDGTADDFVYMHLATPAYVKTDGVVAAGQQIGVRPLLHAPRDSRRVRHRRAPR